MTSSGVSKHEGRQLSLLSLQPLLEQQTNAPMLVINGADDVHIPQQDTLIFEGRADTEVQLLSGTGHCAVTRLDEVIPKMIGWMAQHLRQCVEPRGTHAGLNGHDPYAYLKDLLARLPTQRTSLVHELLPHKWQPQP